MKRLIGALALLPMLAMANSPIGGTITNKTGDKIFISCSSDDENCSEFSINIVDTVYGENETARGLKNTKECVSLVKKGLYKRHTGIRNNNYITAYQGVSVVSMKLCRELGGDPWGCIIPGLLTYPLNIALAPFVGVTHGVSSLIGLTKKKKFEKIVDFMLDPKNKSKAKKITKREFNTIEISREFVLIEPENYKKCINLNDDFFN